MNAVVAKLVWWQLALLLLGTSTVTTAVQSRITERVVVRESNDIKASLTSVRAELLEVRREHNALSTSINAIPAAPQYEDELDALARAVARISIPPCPPCPDDSLAIRQLETRLVLNTTKLMTALRETMVALPDSHVVHLRVRREGEGKFVLRVINGQVRWSKDD
jgi:hypothetical protein